MQNLTAINISRGPYLSDGGSKDVAHSGTFNINPLDGQLELSFKMPASNGDSWMQVNIGKDDWKSILFQIADYFPDFASVFAECTLNATNKLKKEYADSLHSDSNCRMKLRHLHRELNDSFEVVQNIDEKLSSEDKEKLEDQLRSVLNGLLKTSQRQ